MMIFIHLKMRPEESLYNKDIFKILNYLDRELIELGVQRKFNLYSIGGTKLMLEGFNASSKDLDFIISRKDSLILSGAIKDIERKQSVVIDLFYDGEISGYIIPDYQQKAREISFNFDKLKLFCLDDSSFVLTKIIAGRQRDMGEMYGYIESRNISKDNLRKRFS